MHLNKRMVALAILIFMKTTNVIFAVNASKRFHILTDKNFMGDKNQVLGIMDALASKMPESKFEVSTYTDFTPAKDGAYASGFFLISGSTGLNFVKKMNPNLRDKTTIIWSGHQIFEGFEDVAPFISLAIVPGHAVNKDFVTKVVGKTRLLLVSGVPHRITRASLQKARQEFEKKNGPIPTAPLSNMVGVVLPGDAPDANGVMQYFTPQDAQKLAVNIANLEGTNKHYLVTNGPRTGSHNYLSKTKLDPSPHQIKLVDEVTSAFIKELMKKGVKKVNLYDFQFSNLPSVYQSLLSLAVDGMRIHIPGESTSMVTESTDVSRNIIIDVVPSMNSDHHHHLQAIKEQKLANILGWDGKLIKPARSWISDERKTPAEAAALAIIKLVQPEALETY